MSKIFFTVSAGFLPPILPPVLPIKKRDQGRAERESPEQIARGPGPYGGPQQRQ